MKSKFERSAATCTIGTIGHVDHGKTSLAAAITRMLAAKPTTPDTAAVWNLDGFRRTLQAAQSVVLADPAARQPDTFMGLRIIVDETLAPGTVELRSGKEAVRIINLT